MHYSPPVRSSLTITAPPVLCQLQSGIGTYTIPQIATPLYAGVSKALDEAIAWNLNAHVMGMPLGQSSYSCQTLNANAGGYEFLMSNCEFDYLQKLS